jgi:predicted porin
MQKKIIALAVAGLVSGAAFAQSNVVIYGVADAGYVYANDSYNDNVKNISKIYSGGQSGSRLGFKGTEDLGNGLSATFRLEMGIDIDNGSSAQGGRTFGRWSTVGLSGKNWGEIQIGRRDNFTDELLGGFDATGRNTVSQASPIMTQNGSRLSNMVAYLSPVWSGLQVKLGYSTAGWDGATAQEVERTEDGGILKTNNQVAVAGVNYINGPLKVGAVYEYSKLQDNGTSYDSGNLWTVAAGYDFGVVALSAEYGEINYSDDHVVAGGYNEFGIEQRKQWTIGAMFKVGAKDRIGLQYAHGKNEFQDAATSDEKQSMWGLSYFHDLSKRTNVYAAYGTISQDEDNTARYGLDGQGSYQKAFQVGLRHQF